MNRKTMLWLGLAVVGWFLWRQRQQAGAAAAAVQAARNVRLF